MFGLKDNDILVIKVVEHSHSTKRRNPLNRNLGKKDDLNCSAQEPSKENKKATFNAYVDYTKSFNLLDEDDKALGTMMSNTWPFSFLFYLKTFFTARILSFEKTHCMSLEFLKLLKRL